MISMRMWVGLWVGAVLAGPSMAGEAGGLPQVRKERPRIFLRRGAWNGPSVEKVRKWLDLPEYQARWRTKVEPARDPAATGSKNMSLALMWLLKDDAEAGKMALDRFINQRSGGHSPSYWGITDQRMAACYDWLYDHPGFTAEMKKNRAEYLELRCQANLSYLKDEKENPFYSRFAGALAGLTACALAIHGDHPKADDYLRFAYDCFREKMSAIRRAEDGATGGSSYGYHHEFTDLANLVACWRSATDFDAARWVKETQHNWLERQMLFQIWMTYPNGRFVKDGDGWGRGTADVKQYRMSIDAITGMYRSGFGRTAADLIHKRWGLADYHPEYIWEFFVFNDPEVKPRPLEELGRAEVFSPDLHGWVCWRDSWKPDAAIIHFKCGETVDHHATYDQGKFLIFKHTPLAIKNGAYIGYKSSHHRYYKSVWSANCVVFSGPDFSGQQPYIDFDGTPSWEEWKAKRDRAIKRPPTGVLVETEANEKYARALGDLMGSVPAGSSWTRELVFLGYRYLVVLDRVKAASGLSHRWTLHTINEPRVQGKLAVADNEPGRLFCQTLLPVNAKLTKVGGPGQEFDYKGSNRPPGGWGEKEFPPEMQLGSWRLDVAPADGASECVYLHVLYPADTGTDTMPECSVKEVGGDLLVTVGDMRYTFTAPR